MEGLDQRALSLILLHFCFISVHEARSGAKIPLTHDRLMIRLILSQELWLDCWWCDSDPSRKSFRESGDALS